MALLELQDVRRVFSIGRAFRTKHVRAVDGVNLTVDRGETVGLVGESGSGKSTLGRIALHLVRPTTGRVVFDGSPVGELKPGELRKVRRDMQFVSQDPYGSLNGRMSIGDIVAEPLRIHGVGSSRERRSRVDQLLTDVGLRPLDAAKHPHEFSGGQRQRIAIARALALGPKLIVADEPVSALDVSVQAQVLNLMKNLQEEHHLAYLFISHDLSVVRFLSERVVVMYLGRIVESGPTDEVLDRPLHPYTRGLIAAIPTTDAPGRPTATMPGEPPDASAPPAGCSFRSRCPDRLDICATVRPEPRVVEGREVACHVFDDG